MFCHPNSDPDSDRWVFKEFSVWSRFQSRSRSRISFIYHLQGVSFFLLGWSLIPIPIPIPIRALFGFHLWSPIPIPIEICQALRQSPIPILIPNISFSYLAGPRSQSRSKLARDGGKAQSRSRSRSQTLFGFLSRF